MLGPPGTGKTYVAQVLAGEGLGFNNNYAPVSLGPDGSAYVGVLGGLVRLADAVPPPGTSRTSTSGPDTEVGPSPTPCIGRRVRVTSRGIAGLVLSRRRSYLLPSSER